MDTNAIIEGAVKFRDGKKTLLCLKSVEDKMVCDDENFTSCRAKILQYGVTIATEWSLFYSCVV
ncbi:hypothetical protein B566_EDAN004831 [Ephemera danica]|nr:hypothetical protein B566_EDAN004831 [Ephemera danica]